MNHCKHCHAPLETTKHFCNNECSYNYDHPQIAKTVIGKEVIISTITDRVCIICSAKTLVNKRYCKECTIERRLESKRETARRARARMPTTRECTDCGVVMDITKYSTITQCEKCQPVRYGSTLINRLCKTCGDPFKVPDKTSKATECDKCRFTKSCKRCGTSITVTLATIRTLYCTDCKVKVTKETRLKHIRKTRAVKG